MIINNKIIIRHGFHFIFPFQKLREELNAGRKKKNPFPVRVAESVAPRGFLPTGINDSFLISPQKAKDRRERYESTGIIQKCSAPYPGSKLVQ